MLNEDMKSSVRFFKMVFLFPGCSTALGSRLVVLKISESHIHDDAFFSLQQTLHSDLARCSSGIMFISIAAFIKTQASSQKRNYWSLFHLGRAAFSQYRE